MTPLHDVVAQRVSPGPADWGDGLVTIGLYAPGKRRVQLPASFNDWNAQADELEDRGDGFWVTEKHLPPGEIAYQFLIDEQLLLCDPYAHAIRPTQPGQPPHALFQVSRPIFQWRHDDWQRPDLRDLVIYELHVGDFTPQGTLAAVTEKLDYLQSLGVNCVQFMPLYEPQENDYWGYQPAFYFSVRRAFGNMQDLLTLVDEAHARGIGVVLDIVLAHTGRQCPLFQMYPYDQSPWYGQSLGETNQFGLPMLDYRKDPTNHFVRDVQNHWLNVFHFDGFRYDYLYGIGGDLEGKGLPFLMHTAREIRPHAYLIGECIPERPDLVNGSGIGAVAHHRSKLAIQALVCEQKDGEFSIGNFGHTVEVLDPATQEYQSATFMINYADNHDETRLFTCIRQAGHEGQTLFRKASLGMALLMTMPGEPMLYAGSEWGADNPYSQDPSKLRWEMLDDPPHRRLHELTRRLISLRRSSEAVSAGDFRFLSIDAERHCIVFHRKSGLADQVVVAANFSGAQRELLVTFPHTGTWHQFSNGAILNVYEPVHVKLEPYEFEIYVVGVS